MAEDTLCVGWSAFLGLPPLAIVVANNNGSIPTVSFAASRPSQYESIMNAHEVALGLARAGRYKGVPWPHWEDA